MVLVSGEMDLSMFFPIVISVRLEAVILVSVRFGVRWSCVLSCGGLVSGVACFVFKRNLALMV